VSNGRAEKKNTARQNQLPRNVNILGTSTSAHRMVKRTKPPGGGRFTRQTGEVSKKGKNKHNHAQTPRKGASREPGGKQKLHTTREQRNKKKNAWGNQSPDLRGRDKNRRLPPHQNTFPQNDVNTGGEQRHCEERPSNGGGEGGPKTMRQNEGGGKRQKHVPNKNPRGGEPGAWEHAPSRGGSIEKKKTACGLSKGVIDPMGGQFDRLREGRRIRRKKRSATRNRERSQHENKKKGYSRSKKQNMVCVLVKKRRGGKIVPSTTAKEKERVEDNLWGEGRRTNGPPSNPEKLVKPNTGQKPNKGVTASSASGRKGRGKTQGRKSNSDS